MQNPLNQRSKSREATQPLFSSSQCSPTHLLNSVDMTESRVTDLNIDQVVEKASEVDVHERRCQSCQHWKYWSCQSQQLMLTIQKKLIEREKSLQSIMKGLKDKIEDQSKALALKQKQIQILKTMQHKPNSHIDNNFKLMNINQGQVRTTNQPFNNQIQCTERPASRNNKPGLTNKMQGLECSLLKNRVNQEYSTVKKQQIQRSSLANKTQQRMVKELQNSKIKQFQKKLNYNVELGKKVQDQRKDGLNFYSISSQQSQLFESHQLINCNKHSLEGLATNLKIKKNNTATSVGKTINKKLKQSLSETNLLQKQLLQGKNKILDFDQNFTERARSEKYKKENFNQYISEKKNEENIISSREILNKQYYSSKSIEKESPKQSNYNIKNTITNQNIKQIIYEQEQKKLRAATEGSQNLSKNIVSSSRFIFKKQMLPRLEHKQDSPAIKIEQEHNLVKNYDNSPKQNKKYNSIKLTTQTQNISEEAIEKQSEKINSRIEDYQSNTITQKANNILQLKEAAKLYNNYKRLLENNYSIIKDDNSSKDFKLDQSYHSGFQKLKVTTLNSKQALHLQNAQGKQVYKDETKSLKKSQTNEQQKQRDRDGFDQQKNKSQGICDQSIHSNGAYLDFLVQKNSQTAEPHKQDRARQSMQCAHRPLRQMIIPFNTSRSGDKVIPSPQLLRFPNQTTFYRNNKQYSHVISSEATSKQFAINNLISMHQTTQLENSTHKAEDEGHKLLQRQQPFCFNKPKIDQNCEYREQPVMKNIPDIIVGDGGRGTDKKSQTKLIPQETAHKTRVQCLWSEAENNESKGPQSKELKSKQKNQKVAEYSYDQEGCRQKEENRQIRNMTIKNFGQINKKLSHETEVNTGKTEKSGSSIGQTGLKTLKLINQPVGVQKSRFNQTVTDCSYLANQMSRASNSSTRKNTHNIHFQLPNREQFISTKVESKNLERKIQSAAKLTTDGELSSSNGVNWQNSFENENLKSYNRVLLQQLSNSRPKKY